MNAEESLNVITDLTLKMEVFAKPSAQGKRPMGPQIRIGRTGVISLAGGAAQMLGTPERVVLLFDRERRVAGIRAARNDESTISYSLYEIGRSKNPLSTRRVSAQAFLKTYNVPFEDGLATYRPIQHGDMLLFDVTKSETPKRS